MRNISKYRGSKGRYELSDRGDQVLEFFDWWNQCLECYKKQVYSREGFIPVSPFLLCTTSETVEPSQTTRLAPQNVVVPNSASRTEFVN